jgi:hypothetical protein
MTTELKLERVTMEEYKRYQRLVRKQMGVESPHRQSYPDRGFGIFPETLMKDDIGGVIDCTTRGNIRPSNIHVGGTGYTVPESSRETKRLWSEYREELIGMDGKRPFRNMRVHYMGGLSKTIPRPPYQLCKN